MTSSRIRYRLIGLVGLLLAAISVLSACGDTPAAPPAGDSLAIVPIATATATHTPTVTVTVSPTTTPFPTPTAIATAVVPHTPTSTASHTPTATVTVSPTTIAVPTLTATATATPTRRPTRTSPTPTPDRRNADDLAALVALYDLAGGPDWSYNRFWLSDAPLGEWYGVKTDTNGRVIEIDLGATFGGFYIGGNNLSGTIPHQLGHLSELKELVLTGNPRLGGEIPRQLGQLSKLEQLTLSANDLSGSIPSELGRLSNLQWLNLSDNNLSGSIPSELGQLSKLEQLALSANNLSGTIPPELGRLSNLRWLNLSDNNLSGNIPSELEQLANLEDLRIHNANLSGCIPERLWAVPKSDLVYFTMWNQCVPTPTPTPIPGPGSRQIPLPFGVPAEVRNSEDDHWQMTVLNIIPNATEVVMAESHFNDPPDVGEQFYIARLRVKYLGPDSNSFSGIGRLRAVGDGGIAYTNGSCGGFIERIPDPLLYPELFTNGTIEGNVCWHIVSSDAASLLMFVEGPGYWPDSSERVWFTLSGGVLPTPTPTPTPTLTPMPTITPTPGPISTPADLVERVKDGVVQVRASTGSFFVFSSTGSGFIFDVEGTTAFVATNYHVVEGADSLEVTVRNTDSYEALVLGWDADRDVAVLAICCSEDFAALSWEEASPAVGAQVVAVGYPDGGSASRVTATTGEVAEGDALSEQHGYIRHTAPLNPGNSGGPLFSMPDAKVLGINTSRGTQTLSFYAVPLQAIAGQMVEWRKQLVVSP